MNQVDDMRVIDSVNTQVRYLPILFEIVRKIGADLKPLQIVKKMMEEWSKNEEGNNEQYKKGTGKITDKGKLTKAFDFYIDFLQAMGWVIKTESFIKLSKYGLLIYSLKKKRAKTMIGKNIY